MDEYDVAVVGAGPAGASAALAARRLGASVLLLDRSDFPRDKPCGDGIAPHALDVLRELGLTGVEDGFAPVPVLRLVGPGGGEVARPHARPAYTIPRTIFDARIVAGAVAAGASLRRRTVRTLEVRPDAVILDGMIAARVVVGADGAGSTVRRALGQPPNPSGHLALAIRGYAPATGPVEQLIVTSAAAWPAYAWSFPIGDGRANIGYGEVLRGTPVTRTHLLDRLAALLPTVDTGAAVSLRAHHLPLSTHRPIPGRGRLLLAGDALSLINPFTGEGIFYAVLSGSLAGTAAASSASAGAAGSARGETGAASAVGDMTPALAGRGEDAALLDASAAPGADAADRYAAALRRRLGRHLRHSGVAARLGARQWMVDRAVRAAARDQRVFDSLVELGLGDGLLTPRVVGHLMIP